jgi:hypothetical protein
MKKKKISLERKLLLNKETVALLSKPQQKGIAGGGIRSQFCDTYDPQLTCESNPRPGYVCL